MSEKKSKRDDEKRDLIIFLSQFDLSSSKIEQILDKLGEKATIEKFKKFNFVKDKILTSTTYSKIIENADEVVLKTYLSNLENRGIKIVTKADENYPKKLLELPDSPYILYYMGDLSLADEPSLAVVGTRKPTNYGKLNTEKIVREVAGAGVVIVSGLAYGVDSIGHRACLEAGGKTIAVLGCGFDNIYPAEHTSLAKEIAQKGLLISEYRPKMKATKYTFPTRNRIIAGLSDGVFISEAGFKSGTIHTKDFALDYGRNIYSLPGNVDSIASELTNDIIKRGHASMVTRSSDILEDYHLEEGVEQTKMAIDGLSEDEEKIVEYLKSGAKTIDQLTENLEISINNFNTCLTTLEIRGIIRRMSGGYISLN